MIKTVLGNIPECELGITLVHEHFCCYSEYLYQMAGKSYLDKEQLIIISMHYLKELKEKYGLNSFIDCTPVNIGRDIALLKEISQKSGVNIICSTGFYYTEETVLYNSSAELIAEYIIKDAKKVNAGIIKCAVENETISEFNKKLLIASAIAQKELKLPVVLHTNAQNKNGRATVEILLDYGVRPECITVGHLSDTEDLDYIAKIAKCGCYIGLDRLYNNTSEEYINKKLKAISTLCELGFKDKIILSHDELFFNGFEAEPQIKNNPRFDYLFQYILPRLEKKLADEIMRKNPLRMLTEGVLK